MNLEKIYWRDIGGITDSWSSKDELIKQAEKRYNEICESVGWVVYENRKFLIICATYDPCENRYHDGSMIMKSVVVKRELL